LAFFNELSLPKKIYAKIFFGGAMRLSDKIITISQFSKNELIKYTAKKYASKIEVIYRFVGDVIDSQQNIKEQASAKKDEQFFLFVGNVKPNKNLKNALLGFKHAITNNKNLAQNCIFTIVGKKDGFITGDPEISAMIEKDVVLQEKVQFTGHMSDKELIGLYQHALALVFPSYYEGFGLPPLEAMYFGCPTICSNAASIPEICGDASLYFNPSVPAEIGEKMMDIYSSPDLRESLKEKGTRQVNKYSKETAIKEHLRLFDNLMLN
jgi:glycosyltransferase involved in cell wall biosynthesis